MCQDSGSGLVTTPSHVYAQSECHCALYNNCHIKNHNRNCVLLYYLFQENKSFGSKTPLAFILWCTGSCVEHRNNIIKFGRHGNNIVQSLEPSNTMYRKSLQPANYILQSYIRGIAQFVPADTTTKQISPLDRTAELSSAEPVKMQFCPANIATK